MNETFDAFMITFRHDTDPPVTWLINRTIQLDRSLAHIHHSILGSLSTLRKLAQGFLRSHSSDDLKNLILQLLEHNSLCTTLDSQQYSLHIHPTPAELASQPTTGIG